MLDLVSANAEPLSHVFFVDDSIFFCQATESETVCKQFTPVLCWGMWAIHKFGEEFCPFQF